MESTSKRKRWARSWWTVLILSLVGFLGLGIFWHFSIERTNRILREIEALNGKARAGYTINPFNLGMSLRWGELNEVSFLGPRMDDDKLDVLEHAPGLRNLSLTNTRVTDEGLAKLRRFRELRLLTLANMDLVRLNGPGWERLCTPPLTGGKGLAALEDLPALDWVRLLGPGTSDADLKGLARLKNLRKLELMDTRVTDAGVAEFKKAVPGCAVIQGRPALKKP